jgi:hypothetical protein
MALPHPDRRSPRRPRPTGTGGTAVPRSLVAVVSALVALAVILVAATLRRPTPPTFAPTLAASPAGGELVGPVTFTVDASDPDRWRYFSFSDGTVLEHPPRFGWDLAFRRFQVIANGGEGLAGMGGLRDLGPVPFDQVRKAPTESYVQSRVHQGDTLNAAVERWYDYSFFSHLLTPKDRVYAVRTADGRYAKLEFLSYYCPGAQPGCVTFRYVYQGGGGTGLTAHAP